MAKVLISTVYEGKATPIVIYKFSPQKLILLITNKENETRKKTVEEIKSKFGNLLQIELVKTDEFDVAKIAKDVLATIRKEEGQDIYIHVSEGRKTMMLGAMLAGYAAKNGVKGIYYVREDDNEILSLPLLEFKLNKTKEKLLGELAKGNKDANDIAQKLNVHKTAIYLHIRDLIKKSYMTEDWELTPSGKIAIMAKNGSK